MSAAIDLVLQELAAAKLKHPCLAINEEEALVVLASEFGELSTAILRRDVHGEHGIIREAAQVAAVAIRIFEYCIEAQNRPEAPMRKAPLTAVVEDPAECNEGFGPCGACPSCKPALYVHVAGKSVERELVAAILKEFGSSPPPDAAVREAVEAAESLLAQTKPGQYCPWEWFTRTLLRAVQAPRLTAEQVEAVRQAEQRLCNSDYEADEDAAVELRAAFPEAFGVGEV